MEASCHCAVAFELCVDHTVSQPGVHVGACVAATQLPEEQGVLIFLSLQKLKAVTITMEAAAIPVLKWKTHINVNVREDLFSQKTTTRAKVGQKNLPDSLHPLEVKSTSEGTFLLVLVAFS